MFGFVNRRTGRSSTRIKISLVNANRWQNPHPYRERHPPRSPLQVARPRGKFCQFLKAGTRLHLKVLQQFREASSKLRGQVSGPPTETEDRKSTRLNSSHDQISYAVFCMNK